MFMGEYSHTIDTKGRLIIPSKFREELGDEFVLTKGLDGCLSIYPMEQWKIFEKKLEAGHIKFILMDGIGKSFIDKTVTDQELLPAIREILI